MGGKLAKKKEPGLQGEDGEQTQDNVIKKGIEGAVCLVAGEIAKAVTEDHVAGKTEGMGSLISGFTSKAAGETASTEASKKAAGIMSDIWDKLE